jgi:hypothetical protein
MKHMNLRRNPGTREWFCTKCGRTSDHVSAKGARRELDQYDCKVPSVDIPVAPPGTETTRLIKKPYKMTLRKERSGCRFVVADSDDGNPLIRLELFHDTVPSLSSLTVEFEVLSGTTAELARILVGVMNERIVGVNVTPK